MALPITGSGVVIGILVGLDESGSPLVDHRENTSGSLLPARSVIALGQDQVGREVALMFEGGNPRRPIIMGGLQTPAASYLGAGESVPRQDQQPVVVESDGKRLVLTAENEIVLRCGEASITLTRAGKVLIRGTYVLSRSSGANCVKGASIQLN